MTKFSLKLDLSEINDSMELDSNIEVARIENENYALTLEVQGSVRVIYKDCIYKAACQMPDELIQLFHDGKAYNSKDVYVDMNNWFEVFFWEKKDGKLIWTNWCDVVDCETSTPKELESMMYDWFMEYIEDYRISLRDEMPWDYGKHFD